jgi:hypothetical protein
MDDAEREVIRADGLDSDDSAVRAALDLVGWELNLMESDPQKDQGRGAHGRGRVGGQLTDKATGILECIVPRAP